jgi:hypothetical protein
MYRVDGDPNLAEDNLDDLRDRGCVSVRVGISTAGQVQLDIYREAVFALTQVDGPGTFECWRDFAGVDQPADHWDRPDEGI